MWLLINYLAFVGTILLILGHSQSVTYFPAYVSIGFFVWTFVSEVVSQSVTLFSREEAFIKGTPLPLTVYIMRMTMQSAIRAGYTLIGCLGIILIAQTPLSWGWLWSVAGIGLILTATPAIVFTGAIAGAFFPDLQFIVQNLVRIGLFLTPIFWLPVNGSIRGVLYWLNPFTYVVEIVRIPVLTGDFPATAFVVCSTIAVFFWLMALVAVGSFRKQIAFIL
ncbi:ABC transporter permease [Consotaella sp. CSK11QG-6]